MWSAWIELLRSGLDAIQQATGFSWAWSIILFTLVIRLIIAPVAYKQTKSMLIMQTLQPHLKQLQQRYKGNREELNRAMMEFYRDNKVNPLASCLPMLLQLPVMIGLFYELRKFSQAKTPIYQEMQARAPLDFLGIVDDITQNTVSLGLVGFAFVGFYVVSQLFASKVMATSANRQQQILFMILPIVFVPFVLQFPFGLLLYWITTNLLTLVQHVIVRSVVNVDRDIVLPADKKGRKKVIKAKSSGGGTEIRESEQDSNAPPSKEEPPEGTVRPNKRRKRK